MEPYWGPIDAMHQFCEAKYATSPYFAEFWNSLSNIPCFIIPGAYGLYRGWGVFDLRLSALWFNMILVGVGSFMFHGTMRFKWELLDEVPMLMLVLSGIWSKDDTHWCTSGRWKTLCHLLGLGISSVGLYMYISRGDYEMFLHTFTLVCLFDSSLTLICCSKSDHPGSHFTRCCLRAYGVTLVLGRIFWETEARLCPAGSGGPLALLHVLWHVLAGLACYFGLLCDCHNRYAVLGVGVSVDDSSRFRWPLVGLLVTRPAADKQS